MRKIYTVSRLTTGELTTIGDHTDHTSQPISMTSEPVTAALSEIRIAFNKAIKSLEPGQSVTMDVVLTYDPPK